MSEESLERFWKKVVSDVKLQRDIESLFRQVDDRPVASADAIIDLARKRGFTITADELKAHLSSTSGASTSSEDELSETEIEAISGGSATFTNAVTANDKPLVEMKLWSGLNGIVVF